MKLTRRTFAMTGGAALALAAAPRITRAQDVTAEAILFDPDGPVLGNPDGDVTLAEFFDYQCPYCKRGHADLLDLVAQDGGIRLVMKDWPIFGAASIRASQLSLGFASLGQYGAANAALMATPGRLSEAMIAQTLADAGLDVSKAETAYRADQGKWDAYLARTDRQANALHLRGTPAYIIGSTLYPGALERADLEDAIKTARSG
ncbi:disulfide bond formation protein DsbA [Pelagivirga sediminicola]|uniref:Disulfide bond formation protein DsbA n=1 Tax=Pelagivirga sediminicola TaxID=2170575 RepID=A0A2T7G4U4_9RHOB|nr:DsbA family protein [Pelagivirga sediminicola]PVA09448.1 disulfide bond formation protein DsbA [Pelagivirga sediminicola]